jgi:glycosyltransferase involved in cell wall biosynthesis
VNILLLTNDFNLGGSGINAFVFNLSKGLRDRGHKVFIGSNGGNALNQLEENGIRHFLIPFRKNGILLMKSIYTLSKIIKDERIDVIQCNSAITSLSAYLSVKIAGIGRVVSTIHNTFDINFLRKNLRKLGDMVVAPCKFIADLYNVKDKKLRIIYNGIDLNDFSSKRDGWIKREYGISENPILAGFFGGFSWMKGGRFFLESLPIVLKKRKDIVYIFVGGYENEVREAKERYKEFQNNLFFLGRRFDVPEIMKEIDILVVPSLSDITPNVILEGYACGIPPVASNVGGIPEIVKDKETGLLIPPKDPLSIAEAVLELSDNPSLRENLSKNALKISSYYSKERLAEDYEKVFLELLEG